MNEQQKAERKAKREATKEMKILSKYGVGICPVTKRIMIQASHERDTIVYANGKMIQILPLTYDTRVLLSVATREGMGVSLIPDSVNNRPNLALVSIVDIVS